MQLYPTPENAAPTNAKCVSVAVNAKVELRVMTVRPASSKGTVVILSGRADFIERYFETATDLLAQGYAVVCFDWRGQGGSTRLLKDRTRGHVGSLSEYDDDLAAVMTKIVLPDCPPPYFALAHSTGGHILLRALRKRTWFSRAVLTAPLVDVLYRSWPRKLAHVLTGVGAAIGFGQFYLLGFRRGPFLQSEFPNNPLTSDRKRWLRDTTTLEATPELGIGGPTFSWMAAVFKSVRALKRLNGNHRFRCPIMIVTAGLDRVVDNRAVHDLVKRIPGISLVTVAGSQHEILMENDDTRGQFFAAFNSFVSQPSR